MLPQPLFNTRMNTCNKDSQIFAYGNFGYGIYLQDVTLYRNPYTGCINVEVEVDFTPTRNHYFQLMTTVPPLIHQHYIN
ncbi:unnamed protein product [Adineta steineri]|uniref:Uncharacterized protein n=1 Tax=Adineta steineri TaxID=433720 RepID=A0A815GK77_9BILA|nr:unnamed protein product [Adineta steineri]CAF1592405.1 unnamed protein product [Adineta steineri]